MSSERAPFCKTYNIVRIKPSEAIHYYPNPNIQPRSPSSADDRPAGSPAISMLDGRRILSGSLALISSCYHDIAGEM